MWILSTVASMGYLSRMTQWKVSWKVGLGEVAEYSSYYHPSAANGLSLEQAAITRRHVSGPFRGSGAVAPWAILVSSAPGSGYSCA